MFVVINHYEDRNKLESKRNILSQLFYNKMYAGKKLRQLRLQLELNQTEMANSLGLSQSYYSAVEAGKRKITAKMIEKVTAKWKINDGYFSNNEPVTFDKIMRGNNEGVREGVKQIERLSEADLTQRIRFIDKEIIKKLEEIKSSYPDLHILNKEIYNLYQFKEFIDHYADEFFGKYWENELPDITENYKDFDFEKWKLKKIKTLIGLSHFKPAFDKMHLAILEFYESIAPYDKENVISEYRITNDSIIK
jgi:transcriptional regulator with XRE-family HTH domain